MFLLECMSNLKIDRQALTLIFFAYEHEQRDNLQYLLYSLSFTYIPFRTTVAFLTQDVGNYIHSYF